MLDCSEKLDSAGDPVGVALGVVGVVHCEGGDGWLVMDEIRSALENVDKLDCPEGLDVVGDPVDAALDVVDVVHGEGGDGWLDRDVVWSVLEKVAV